MTKEQVQQHGDVIKWFCDNPDKGVWVKRKDTDTHIGLWDLVKVPKWVLYCIYVQNDEYAELRKAQADGKVVECCIKPEYGNGCWDILGEDDKDELGVFNHKYNYRIKPDEPMFKVGDWVYTEEGYLGKVTNHISNDFYAISGMNRNSKISRLWTPQEGDVVIFLNDNLVRITQLRKSNISYAKELFTNNKCIPYIGQPFKEIK